MRIKLTSTYPSLSCVCVYISCLRFSIMYSLVHSYGLILSLHYAVPFLPVFANISLYFITPEDIHIVMCVCIYV